MDIRTIEEYIQRVDTLSADDRAAIFAAAKKKGITIPRGRPCVQCTERILLQMYEMEATRRNVSQDGYRLRDIRTSIRAGAVVINNATITGMTVGTMHPHIIAEFFEKIEDDTTI